MATRDELYTALRNADKSGDADGARKLVAYIQSLPAEDATAAGPLKVRSVAPNSPDSLTGRVAAGGALGVADLGNIVLNAVSPATNLLPGGAQWNRTRNADFDAITRANEDSTGFTLGRIGGNVLTTAPVGGAIAGTARAIAPVLAAGRAAPLVNAIASAGMRTGAAPAATLAGKAANLGVRALGGAITGGAAAALVTPEHTGTGAAVGAALPAVFATLGVGGKVAGAIWRGMTARGDLAGAQALAKALDIATPEAQAAIIAKLRSAETLVPGASPTVAQALRTPEAGILNRIVYDAPGGNALRGKIEQQGAARVNALESVAAPDVNGFASARADMGNAIARAVIPQEKAAGKAITAKYNAVDPGKGEVIGLPINQMQAAIEKYMGRGTFGSSNGATNALAAARELVPPPVEAASAPTSWSVMGNQLRAAADDAPGSTGWDEISNLRSSINKATREAKLAGDKQALAALGAQKNAIDNAISTDLSPTAKAAWVDANASHAAKMDRFHTGPQKAIFRTGSDGLPLVEGGEVAAKFWGSGAGAAENVASFRKLIGDNPQLLGQFKSMVTTQGASMSNDAGNLTTKFSKWVDQSLPGLRNAFTPAEVKQLQNIAADIDRNAVSMKAGTSLGGSNTHQNATNALNLGLLDSAAMTKAANMVPKLNYLTGPALEGLKGWARNSKAAKLAELLSDSTTAADALERLTLAGATPREANQILQMLEQEISRSAPAAEARRREQRQPGR
jgi:hypothetical protein